MFKPFLVLIRQWWDLTVRQIPPHPPWPAIPGIGKNSNKSVPFSTAGISIGEIRCRFSIEMRLKRKYVKSILICRNSIDYNRRTSNIRQSKATISISPWVSFFSRNSEMISISLILGRTARWTKHSGIYCLWKWRTTGVHERRTSQTDQCPSKYYWSLLILDWNELACRSFFA